MIRKTETINLRIDHGVKEALWRLAEHEHRSIANTYGGILYRAGKVLLSAGYENRRGIIGGIAFTW